MFPNYCDPAVVFMSAAVLAHSNHLQWNDRRTFYMCYKLSLCLKTSAWVAKQCARARSARAKGLCSLPQKTCCKHWINLSQRKSLWLLAHKLCALGRKLSSILPGPDLCFALPLILLAACFGWPQPLGTKPCKACACPDKPPEICNSTEARRNHHESSNSHSQEAAGAGCPSTAMPTAQLGWGPQPWAEVQLHSNEFVQLLFT